MAETIADIHRELGTRISLCSLRYDCLSGGSHNSQIALIGQCPGIDEARIKLPFVGESGQLLKDTLRKMHLQPTECYQTNACKRMMDNDKLSHDEYTHWRGILEWELNQLPNLKYIVILGALPFKMLVNEAASLTKWRGSCLNVNGRWYIICNNPAYALHQPEMEVVFRFDMAKLTKVMEGRYKPYEITYHTDPSPTEAIQWTFKMLDEKKPVSYDIETMSRETVCIGLANNEHEGMCINFRDITDNRWSVSDEARVRIAIARLVSSDRVQLVAQNAAYDMAWLWYKDRIRVRATWFDTMLAHHALYPLLPHGLDFLTAQYTDHPYYKDEGKDWREKSDLDITEFWRYNIKDCCITLAAANVMHKELVDAKLDNLFFNHIMRLQPHLIRMTVLGVKVDIERKKQLDHDLGIALEATKESFYEAVATATGDAGYRPNPNSPDDVASMLYDRFGIPIPKYVRRKRGEQDAEQKASTDKEARKLAALRATDPQRKVLKLLDKYKEDHKFYSTYVQSAIDNDGRMRCSYRQTGVKRAPGRLSSSDNPWGTATNMQNQPEGAKRMFMADEGYELGYFDLAQAEARVVAWIADIFRWKQQFERARQDGSFDCHRALASEMFHIKYEDTPKEDRTADGKPTKRYIAKRCRHGLNYRMFWHRLAQVLDCSVEEAQVLWNAYHNTTPEIRRWWSEVEHRAKKERQLTTCYGRRLLIMGRLSASKDKDAYDRQMEAIIAFEPQSTIGDKVSECIYLMEDDEGWPQDARILLNMHDALIFQARPHDITKCLRIAKRYAEKALILRGEKLIIPADVARSECDSEGNHYWSSLKKVKLELSEVSS